MYVVTGGAGFIGSVIVWKLNREGIDNILIVDNLDKSEKWKNLVNRNYTDYVNKEKFLELVLNNYSFGDIEAVIHMGACSSTTENDAEYLIDNNYKYSKILGEFCLSKRIRYIYASSAATYGDGKLGFSDEYDLIPEFKPMNMYGYSKQLFDLWVLKNNLQNEFVGLKFFNVYGPNEYHKDDMASLVYKAYHQILKTGQVKLFKSHKPEYKHGEQLRDFIYVKDCSDVVWWFLQNKKTGIFNLGTGTPRTWLDLANSVFKAMNKKPDIEFIPVPESIRAKYQYYTKADMTRLREAGFDKKMTNIERGVDDYIKNYLAKPDPYI